MIVLIAGILLWSVAHLFVAVAPYKRKKLMARMGVGPYKGCFALTIILSMVLIVIGWRSSRPELIYLLPAWVKYLTFVFSYVTFVLFVAAQVKTNIKRVLRHPQLTGLVFWSTGHLLVNGDSRSLVLFLGLLVWAKLQIIATNRRDGKRSRPDAVPVRNDLFTVIGGSIVFTIFLFAHPYITGVALL